MVGNSKERSSQRSEYRKLVIRPFNGSERRAQGFHFFPMMKGARTDQHVWNAASLESPGIVARHILAECNKPSKQDTDIARGEWQPLARICRIANLPAALLQKPLH